MSVQAPPMATMVNGSALAAATINMSVTVTNTGLHSAAAVMTVTYHRVTRRVVRNLCELCGFGKVMLAAGASTVVSISIRLADLARWTQML